MAFLIPTVLLSLQLNFIIAQSSVYNLFASDLLPLVADNRTSQNIIYSPVSIYTTLAVTYLGAENSTADEIRKVLKLNQERKISFASKYGEFLRTMFRKTEAKGEAPQLKMANRLYVDNKIKILPSFNKMVEENFDCKAENVDFSQGLPVVEIINKWVEQQTDNKIKNLMKPDTVDKDTSAISVNALYFKAKWLHPFSNRSTFKRNFYMGFDDKLEVDTMYTEDKFGYVDLPELKASAIEMPYANSTISMLIILPDRNNDLQTLIEMLKAKDLNSITSKMVVQTTVVYLPKFKIDFEFSLKDSLKKLGCSTMFGDKANLTGIFEGVNSHKISDIKHKAFLDCNEGGSEVAAATFVKIGFRSFNYNRKFFRANRPFLFFIHSKISVLFAGHVAKF